MLLEAEVPHVHSAFKISGYTPAQVTGGGGEMAGVTYVKRPCSILVV